MKFIALFLVIIIFVLQYHIWFDQDGLKEFRLTEQRLTQMENLSRHLQIRNNALRAEIDDLRHGQEVIIETSRRQLGFIHKGEVYYQIVT